MEKHIVFIDDAATFGGAQIALCSALEVLASSKNFRLTAIANRNNKKLVDRIGKTPGVNLIECPSSLPANIFLFFLRFPEFYKIFKSLELKNVDHWIINLSGIEFGLAAAILLKRRGKRVFGWLHLPDRLAVLMPKVGLLKLNFYKIRDALAEYFLFTLYDKFMVPSKASRETLLKRSKNISRPHVVYNIRKDIETTSTVLTNDSLCFEIANALVMAVIGRIDFSHKGQDRTIGIGLELIRRGLSPFFIFIGDGQDADALRAAFEKAGLHNNFRITGWQEDVTKWLHNVSVVLIPSRFEGLPLVAPEAMALKKRIVSSTLPCFAEVLPPICISKTNDSEDYTNAILQVLALDEDDLTNLYASYLNEFSPNSFLNRIDELLGTEVQHAH